jgi:hypothetical protein
MGYRSLDGLSFPSNHFDFVRIVGIGLGVPEDEVGQKHDLTFNFSFAVASGRSFWRFDPHNFSAPKMSNVTLRKLLES